MNQQLLFLFREHKPLAFPIVN